MRVAELRHRAAAALWLPLWTARAEILTSLAMIAGWAALTWGLVGFFPAYAAPIWRLALGLLFLSLAGWKFVASIATAGLYALTRKP